MDESFSKLSPRKGRKGETTKKMKAKEEAEPKRGSLIYQDAGTLLAETEANC